MRDRGRRIQSGRSKTAFLPDVDLPSSRCSAHTASSPRQKIGQTQEGWAREKGGVLGVRLMTSPYLDAGTGAGGIGRAGLWGGGKDGGRARPISAPAHRGSQAMRVANFSGGLVRVLCMFVCARVRTCEMMVACMHV